MPAVFYMRWTQPLAVGPGPAELSLCLPVSQLPLCLGTCFIWCNPATLVSFALHCTRNQLAGRWPSIAGELNFALHHHALSRPPVLRHWHWQLGAI